MGSFQPVGGWGLGINWNTQRRKWPSADCREAAFCFLDKATPTDMEIHRTVRLDHSTNNFLILHTVLVKAKTFFHIFISINFHFHFSSLSPKLEDLRSRLCDCHMLLIPGVGITYWKRKWKSPYFRAVWAQGTQGTGRLSSECGWHSRHSRSPF